eukprot:COSAG04_NODE_3247_length_3009_cov_2.747423_4_plen_61_part_00
MSLLNADGNPMRYNNLGGTGLMVSEVSFGTMTFSDVDKAATGALSPPHPTSLAPAGRCWL